MELRDYLLDRYMDVEPSGEGFTISIEKIVDYTIMVYIRDDAYQDVTLNQKKEAAFIKVGIQKESDQRLLMLNKSNIVSRVVTTILHATANREFELYVSALEASTILLDVVRRPIDDTLDDEKWLSALRAKKQGFNDARELLSSANEIAEKMLGAKETDLDEHVEETIFKEGFSERLAKKANKKN